MRGRDEAAGAGPLAPEEREGVPLSAEQRAALAIDAGWLEHRAVFRRRMIRDGHLRHPWRSVFEADMLFSLIGHNWLEGRVLTLKEAATYFRDFASESTVMRHIDDMVAAGTLVRRPDPRDRRRLLLIPTARLVEIGAMFLEARVEIARRYGFVYDPERAAAGE